MAKYIEECDPDGPVLIYLRKCGIKVYNICGRILCGTYTNQLLRVIRNSRQFSLYESKC